MLKYGIKRIFAALLAVIILITATFFLMHMVPGSPFLSERMTDKVKANLEKKYGLDKPLGTQYLIYVGDLLQGDMGTSLQKKGRRKISLLCKAWRLRHRSGCCCGHSIGGARRD
jgi:oligopeptide transport system permease protein